MGEIIVEEILSVFASFPSLAVLLSLCLSVGVAVLGVVPSAFVTLLNIRFFGFWEGTLLSFAGEMLGAWISFYLYRSGLKRLGKTKVTKHETVKKLLEVQGKEAFQLVLYLRLLPFIPSGAVTLFSALGRMGVSIYMGATLIGKMPSLLIEAYSVNEVLEVTWQGKVIITLIVLYMLYLVFKKIGFAQKAE